MSYFITPMEAKRGRYDQLKFIARQHVAESFSRRFQLEGQVHLWDNTILESISDAALEYAANVWPKYYDPENGINGLGSGWAEFYKKYFYTPSFFDLAIWQKINGERVLQGLCLGRPSRGKEHLRIFRVESSRAPNYFKGGIYAPMLACAQRYAEFLECERLIVKKTIDINGLSKYGFQPFNLRQGYGDFLSKELTS